MQMRVLSLLLLVSISLSSAGKSSPTQENSQKIQTPPLVQVTTRLVQLSVIAEDSHGKPVLDLTKEDFILFDEDRREEISVFSKETRRELANAETAPVPANFFSNRVELKTGVASAVTLILLDYLNTPPKEMIYARQQLIKFLSEMQPTDRIALYAMTTDLIVLHDFTSDPSPLIRTVREYRARNMAAIRPLNGAVPQLGPYLFGQEGIADTRRLPRFQMTHRAFQVIAGHVARVPGRKNLVWITTAMRAFVNQRIRAILNDAGIAVYPVDPRGLITYGIPASDPADSPNVRRGGVPPLSQTRPNFEVMADVAKATGGRAFYNLNDLAGSIRRAMDDSDVAYVLGFYPTHREWNGKFHKLTVEVKRPGVTVRHRTGYFADLKGRPHLREEKEILEMAFTSKLDLGSVGTSVQVDPQSDAGEGALRLAIEVDARDIPLEPEKDRWRGRLELFLVQRNSAGKQLSSKAERITMNLTPRSFDEVMKNGVILHRDVQVTADAAELRVVVWNSASGSIGSVIIPLDTIEATGRN